VRLITASALCITVLALSIVITPGQAQSKSNSECQNFSGEIAGQIIGPSSLCDGALTEIGTFTGLGGGNFVACITEIEEVGQGQRAVQMVQATHTYTLDSGPTFSTMDEFVLAPTSPPIYHVNTRSDITGGSGALDDAFGFIRTHGTVDLQAGVVTLKYNGRICTPQ
jgi:hypothetical protein